MLLNCYTRYVSKFGKFSSSHRIGKGQFSFQTQRRAIPKGLHMSHVSRVILKILQARLQQYVNQELPDVQAGFRRGRETRDQITNIGNFITGFCAFSKSTLYIWKFSIHILLVPSLKDFEHNLTSMGNECNCMVV